MTTDDTPEPSSASAVIRAASNVTTFVQTWTLTDAKAQHDWLTTAHRTVHLLRAKSGFISMSLHRSVENNLIVMYAQWETAEQLDAAIADPAAVAGHDELARFGTPSGALYLVDAVYGPIPPLKTSRLA